MNTRTHAHAGMSPTGFKTRRVAAPPGVEYVEYPVPRFDEVVGVPCPDCVEVGAAMERERLKGAWADWFADAILQEPSE